MNTYYYEREEYSTQGVLFTFAHAKNIKNVQAKVEVKQ